MALGLHPDCISRLTEAVAGSLAQVRVNNDVFLDFESTLELVQADKILPQTGVLRDRIEEYVGELPLFNFLYDSISRDIHETGSYNSKNEVSQLNSLPNYKDLKNVASRLIQDFESLPWNYLVWYELPGGAGAQLRNAIEGLILSDALRLVSPNESYDEEYPLPPERRRGLADIFLNKFQTKPWNPKAAYLQTNVKGFIGWHGGLTIDKVIETLKSFVGLCIAVHLLKVKEEQSTPLFYMPAESRLIVYRQLDGRWQFWTTYELPLDLSETLSRLEINNQNGQIKDEQIAGWIKNRLPVVSTAFQNPEKAERVLLAGQWLLDSYVGKNELLSFVQTTVAMETLLGDEAKSDVIGIGELLRNRCAYLIGKSYSQREKILKDFNKIYDVRSKIVHRGKSRLTSDERSLFRTLQWMCRRVISEELELISKDTAEAT